MEARAGGSLTPKGRRADRRRHPRGDDQERRDPRAGRAALRPRSRRDEASLAASDARRAGRRVARPFAVARRDSRRAPPLLPADGRPLPPAPRGPHPRPARLASRRRGHGRRRSAARRPARASRARAGNGHVLPSWGSPVRARHAPQRNPLQTAGFAFPGRQRVPVWPQKGRTRRILRANGRRRAARSRGLATADERGRLHATDRARALAGAAFG